VALADQLLQLLAGVTDLLLHHLARHSTVRKSGVPDMLCALTNSQVLVRKGRNLLLILPHQIANVAHSHGQQAVCSGGTECEGRRSTEEDTAVTRDDRAGHGGYDNVHAAGEKALTGLGRRSERRDGVGEAIFDVESPGEELVEALLCGKGV
jgi:hypothetical protein